MRYTRNDSRTFYNSAHFMINYGNIDEEFELALKNHLDDQERLNHDETQSVKGTKNES